MNNSGIAWRNLYILCLTSPTIKILFFLDTEFNIYSCTKLLSWYSSIAISSYFSWYFFATKVSSIFPSFSFINILSAKCSTSWKSTIFLSLFLLENSSPNSNIIFSNFNNILYISKISLFAVFESQTNTLFKTFKLSFTESLMFFASSFSLASILSPLHFINSNTLFISYALSQLFKFAFRLFNISISASIIFK